MENRDYQEYFESSEIEGLENFKKLLNSDTILFKGE